MMGAIIDWAWRALYRLVCDDCRGFIWPWQPRHRNRHRRCDHAQRDRLYTESVRDYDYPVLPWTCPECGAPAVLR